MEENEWTSLAIRHSTKDNLEERKIHPKQSYDEVIQGVLSEVHSYHKIREKLEEELFYLRNSETDRDEIIPKWRDWLEALLATEPNPETAEEAT